MVQLRCDILEDVTRLYFERKKIVLELERSIGRKDKVSFEKQIRMEELTAYIDALTGGGFSAMLREK